MISFEIFVIYIVLKKKKKKKKKKNLTGVKIGEKHLILLMLTTGKKTLTQHFVKVISLKYKSFLDQKYQLAKD